MPKSLLAVDDSVTMRKVVQMTFAGEDLTVATVGTAAEALAAIRKSRPDLVLADVSLEGTTGYDLCRSIKDEFQSVPVIIVSSKQNPWDPAKGQASGADEHADKPWDTGKLIELVKKVLAQGKSVAPAPIAAAAAPGIPAAPPTPAFATAPVAPAAPVITAAPTPKLANHPHHTLAGMPAVTPTPAATPAAKAPAAGPISIPKPAAAEAPLAPKPAEPVSIPRPITPAAPPVVAKAPEPIAAPAAPLAPVAAPSNGHPVATISAELSGKLSQIGLSAAQVDAVLALSREVVERVVWEVVPVLAETMVREEIARLTREG